MGNALVVQNLNYKNILKNINLELEEGKIYALLGEIGSGKTTLLKNIFSLADFSGSNMVNGVLLNKDNKEELRKEIGIYLGLNIINGNVYENIAEILYNLNYEESKIRKKVYDLSKRLGMDRLLYKDVNELSYSEKKFVSFARSIIHEPKLILIDGLFDSIDKSLKSKIISYLKYLKKDKKCIVFTSSNSEDINISDNIIIMNSGKIIINDEKDKVLKEESIFKDNNIKLPFLIDLSYKLISYDLIDHLIDDYDKMVDEIWE